jgi:hypothetical integral membrane protein (TIGR02206 family)
MHDPNSWQNKFHPYTLTHLCVVLVFLAFVVAMVWMRRSDVVADDPPLRRRMDRIIGWICLAGACFVQLVTLWPSRFDYRASLPLHICDIVMFIAPLALLLHWRSLRSIAYFWGLGLSSISFIYPDLWFGPGHFQFWVFWTGHACIVGAALYDITGCGFRPKWHDYRFIAWFSILYVLILLPIDAHFHLNYGYIGKTYGGQRSPTDFLGVWPWRVPLMLLMALGVMFALLLPWVIRHKIAAKNLEEKQESGGPTPQGLQQGGVR